MELSHKRFDEVFDLQLGRTPARGVDKYWGGTNTWVSIADMGQSKFISSSKECISDTALAETGIPLVPKDVVIMSFKLSIGKVAITKRELYTNEAIMAFIPKPGTKIMNDYLYYYLQGYKWDNSNNVVMGFTLNKKSISSSVISYPSLPEQQRIVDILDREFAKIDALKANAEKSLQATKDLFQATLKKELEPKEGWTSEELSSICRVINGRAYSKEEFFDTGKYRVLRVGNFFTNDKWYYSNLELEEDKYCEQGDLLYAWSASFGPWIWEGEKVIYHYHIWKLVNKDDAIRKKFLYYWLMSPFFMSQTMNDLHGTTMVHITKGIMEKAIVSFPSVPEQDYIVGEIEQASHLCKSLQDNYQKTLALCDDLKQALLRKAFNGEL